MNSIMREFILTAIPNPVNEERRMERIALKLSYKSEKKVDVKIYIFSLSPSAKYLHEVRISSYNSIKYMR